MEKLNKTLDQVAEGYLNDLVNRSLLQIVRKSEFGPLKCFQMHDVIRHFAIEKAKKECFGKVYGGHRTFSVYETRRLSIQSTNIEFLNQSRATHLRTIYVFTSSVDVDLLKLILASSVLLSTLDLQGTQIKELPNEVFSLFNLRLLGLRYSQIESLPEAVGRLHNLEVLDAMYTCLVSLPKAIEKLKKLRYLFASVKITNELYTYTWFRGVKVPRGLRNLTGLHVLHGVKASSEVLRDVSDLTELRAFGVDGVTSEHSLNLRGALLNMTNLVSLSITASKIEELPLEELHLPETLFKLALVGQLEKKWMPRIISSWLHLNNLTKLYLGSSKLDEDSFTSLMVLRNLSFLFLYNAYEGNKLCISALSFPRLLELHIHSAPQLNHVKIENGALGSLVKLWMSWCPELKRLPHGIEYLGALEELYLIDTADEFIEMLVQESETNECKEELMKIKHIGKVIVKSTEKNFWKRIVSRDVNEFAG